MGTALPRVQTSVISLLAGLLLQVPVLAQPQPGQKIEVSKLGPLPGQRVPDFNLKDQTGKTWNLRAWGHLLWIRGLLGFPCTDHWWGGGCVGIRVRVR